jgi:two-component system, OmpR family, phosphate regulon sensor histidine kinase PhoR
MSKFSLTIFISLISSLLITFLIYSAGATQDLLIIFFAVVSIINFITIWVFFEFVIFRDALNIKDLIAYYLKGNRTSDIPDTELILRISKQINNDLRLLQRRKEKEVDGLHKRADFRSQFIADISHELKTPIFAAQGYVHTLLDGAVEDKEVRFKFLKKSANNLDFLDNLVKDLLELSQIETGNIVLMHDHFDMVKLVDEVIDDFGQQASKAGISVSRSKKEDESIVYADFMRIRQILQNLISNGIKYNKPGGKLKIKISDKGNRVRIKVADSGVGISEDDQSQIFQRFYRVDKSRTKSKKVSSSGLGLAIVKHLLESHGSAIQVKSEVGKGSVFSFYLQKDKPNGQRIKTEELDTI